MSEQKHTPGAWELWQAPTGEFAVRTTYTDDQGRRTTTWPAVCNAGGQPNEANARLIAAAPDMLEALKQFVEEYVEMINSGDCGFWDPEKEDKVIKARAALSKALTP